MSETIFARIAKGEIPAAFVYRDDRVMAFMDAGQVNPGHVIVATTAPHATILDLDDALAGHVFQVAARIARAVEKAYKPAGLTILQANRPAGWQTVPHFHLHVLPRHADDGVGLVWPRKEPGMAALTEYAARVTAAL